jgi:soluble lytic murein transglycosylase-like protein
MQVMPFHAGNWGCSSSDLFEIDANICHGVQILADNLKHSRNLPAALQRYNGCVRGANTPDCYRYAGKVYRSARRTAVGLDGKVTATTPFSSLN